MAFELKHWANPRATIANAHKDDDFAYCLHGAQMAADVLKLFDLKPSELKNLTILDYGCGTGRISRVLASYFKHVYAYDPAPECIQHAKTECPSIKIENITFYNDLDDIPVCDVACSINVIEHLTPSQARFAINAMNRKTGDGMIALWYLMGAIYNHEFGIPIDCIKGRRIGLICLNKDK